MTDQPATLEPGLVGTEDQASAASSPPLVSSAASSPPLVSSAASSPPLVSGNPTPEEVAALVAVLCLVGGATASPPAPVRSTWADPARVLGGPVAPRGGWRASALPR